MALKNTFFHGLAEKLLMRRSLNAPGPWLDRLLKLDKAGSDELMAHNWKGFLKTFKYAYESVPYYRETYDQAGVSVQDLKSYDDLLKIPPITKRRISANFPDRITSDRSDRDSWTYIATSGTTDRLMVVTDPLFSSKNEALSIYGSILRDSYVAGALRLSIPPDACSLACAVNTSRNRTFMDRMKQAAAGVFNQDVGRVSRSFAGRILRKIARPMVEMPSFGPSGTRIPVDQLDWYVRTISRLKPVVLSGLPTYLQIIARHIRSTGADVRLEGSILPQGALSNPSLKKELEEAFHIPVHEVYGAHELGSVASTCKAGGKLHINMDAFLVETVRDGKHVGPGELGEVLITSYINSAMPLIRYKPGDIGRIYDGDCECGRHGQTISLEGRIQDAIITSNGVFTNRMICEYFARQQNIEFFQLVQRDDTRFDLLVVEKEKGSVNQKDLAAATREYLGPETNVRIRIVSTIKPEVSGKFRFVKSTSYEKFNRDPAAETEVDPFAAITGADKEEDSVVDAFFE